MSRQVKRLKGMSSATTNSSIRTQARAALGEAFGTKKAQAAIRAAERNKVDIAAMEDVADHLQVGIEASTASLPSKGEHTMSPTQSLDVLLCIFAEQAKATHDGNRPIPPVNLEATTPAEVKLFFQNLGGCTNFYLGLQYPRYRFRRRAQQLPYFVIYRSFSKRKILSITFLSIELGEAAASRTIQCSKIKQDESVSSLISFQQAFR
jgi:hypothetical protein